MEVDRLARSLKELITTVEKLDARGIGFRSLTEENRQQVTYKYRLCMEASPVGSDVYTNWDPLAKGI